MLPALKLKSNKTDLVINNVIVKVFKTVNNSRSMFYDKDQDCSKHCYRLGDSKFDTKTKTLRTESPLYLLANSNKM